MFHFVKATPHDADELARVQGRAFAVETPLYGSGPPGCDSPAWQVETMAKSPYYVIRESDKDSPPNSAPDSGGKIIGGIVVSDQGDGHYYLHRLFVDPDCQRRGAASQALAFIEETLPACRWTLHTPYKSYGNHGFYEKRGYIKIGEMRPDEPDVPEDFLLFHYEKTTAGQNITGLSGKH